MHRGLLRAAIALAAATAGGVAISACGSQARTVTVSSAPRSSLQSGSSTTHATASSTSSTQSTAASSSSTAAGAASTTTTQVTSTSTRTSTAPAFVGPKAHGTGLHAAIATVQSQGYTPTEPSQFRSSQTLEVLVASKQSTAEGQQQQAFFFLNGKYLGTDASKPSAQVSVVSEGDTEVTLAYALYRLHGSLWQPTGGEAKVTYQLNDGKLVALEAIPPTRPPHGAGRL